MAGANTTHRPLWTSREREVLDLIARGQTNGQIAETLGISFATAKWHVSELISKLGVSSREEVADYWRAEQRMPRRLARTLGGMLTGMGLKVAAGGAVVGVVGTSILWAGLAIGERGEEGVAEPPPVASVPTPTATVPSFVDSGRPTGCPQKASSPDRSKLMELLLCPALKFPEISVADKGGCDLSGANLGPAGHIDHIDFRGCRLDDADLSGWTINSASLEAISARRANFAGAPLSQSILRDADLRDADLSRSNFQMTDLTNANLTGADLTNAITRGAIWKNTTCPDGTNSDANGGTCVGTLSVSDYWPSSKDGGWTPPVCLPKGETPKLGLLCDANLYPGITRDASGRCDAPFHALASPDLRWADLRGCSLAGGDLEGVDLERASLVGADLTGTNLSGAKLFLADLSGANLSGVNLDRAVVSHTSLEGANLTGASTKGTLLRGIYKNTICPDGTNSDLDDGDRFTCAGNTLP